MKKISFKSIHIPILLFGVVAVLYGSFEYLSYANHPRHISTEDHIRESLDTSVQLFDEIHDSFASHTYELKELFINRSESGISRQQFHSDMRNYPFWGVSVYRNESQFAWSGFNPPLPDHDFQLANDSLYINLYKDRNVVFLLGQVSFNIGEEQFQLYTTKRIEQKNIIPIARDRELDLARDSELEEKYPVTFTFFDHVQEPLNDYRKLQTQNADSVGVVYADYGDEDRFYADINAKNQRWRTLFQITLFFLVVLIFFSWSFRYRTWESMYLQIGGLSIIWMILTNSDIPVRWIPQFLPNLEADTLMTLEALSYYTFHALFICLISFSVITSLTKKWRFTSSENHYQTFLFTALFSALNVFLIYFFISKTYDTAMISNVSLLELEMIPSLNAWIFYIATGVFISSVAAFLICAWWFLFISDKDKTIVISVIALVSFILFYYLGDLVTDRSLFVPWKLLLSIGLFAAFLSGALYIYHFPRSYLQISGFRLLLLAALLSSISGYSIYSSASLERMDEQLKSTITDFIEEEDQEAREVTRQLLATIEQRMIFLSEEDITQRRAQDQAQFRRIIQSNIQDRWRRYSYDIHMIDTNGNLIADYATNLDSPGYAGFYDLRLIETSYQQERLSWETNRPIIHGRPHTVTADDYTTFFRGWIPIYNELQPDKIIAWIVAAVYVERPDFNKPIRAVLAATTVDDWRTSYYLSEYTDGVKSRSMVKGIYAKQPKYNRLPEREREIAERDSIAFISNLTSDGKFRELILKTGEGSYVKASTPVVSFNNHLFSFFRFNVVILVFGLVLFTLFSFSGLKTFSLFSQSRKFRHRLLDGLALATLLFLVVLIVATQYAVNRQNESNLQQEIISNLDTLAETVRIEHQGELFQAGFGNISRATYPLDVDAIFYDNLNVSESTTPQIFQQYLIPDILPFPVYDFLYNRQRNHYVTQIDIGEENLLIGYRVLMSELNEPAGVVAIPTFLQSPLYTEQLMETTSYLLAFYLLIFGFFIIGTFFISQQLTKPLQYIQAGLNKISSGNLETTIPVKSQDEIGSLSTAYNVMVSRLKELQKNLVEAEREAAWKEMAQQVAHEIKNPLTPMKLNLQHLQRQLEQNPENAEKLREHVEKVTVNIIEQIDSLNKIASDFSKFARPMQEEFSDVEINELIRTLAEFYETDSEVTVRQDLHRRPLMILGSANELRRTLINLIKNSFEAMNGEGELLIRTSKNRSHARIEITDNGSGIPVEDQDRIFVPNFSTKSSGTGLGLAISKKIIEAHHGTISFRSETGKGTTFTIEIPMKGHTPEISSE